MSDETTYPNREHMNADEAAHRRALHAIMQIRGHLDLLERRLRQAGSNVEVDGADAGRVIHLAGDLREYLTQIEVLRDVREWHTADIAEAARDDHH